MAAPSSRPSAPSLLGALAFCLALAVSTPPAAAAAAEPSASLVIRWTKVPGAAGYVIQVGADKRMRTIIAKAKVTSNVYRWTRLSRRKFYWRVAAVDAAGRVGHFSGVHVIRPVVSSPKPTAPASGARLGFGAKGPTVVFKWRGAEGIREYTVTITSARGAQVVKRVKTTSLSWVAPSVDRYTWRVSGVDYNGGAVKAGAPRKFTVFAKPPAPSKPRHGATVPLKATTVSVALRWSARPVEAYSVQLAGDGKFKHLIEERRVNRPSATFKLKRLGRYYWRVRGRKPDTSWSVTRVVRVVPTRPRPVAPADGAQVVVDQAKAQVKLSWTASHGATAYEVQLRNDKVVASAAIKPVTTQGTSFTTPPLPAGFYRWAVRAVGTGSHRSAWAKRRFQITEKLLLPAPVLAQPTSGSAHTLDEGDLLALSWGKVSDAVTYEVQVARSDDFREVLATYTSAGPTVSVRPDDSGKLFWRARGVSAAGRGGLWSTPRWAMVTVVQPWRWQPDDAATVELGIGGGLTYNLGEVLTGQPAVELSVWLPVLRKRLGVALRTGWFTHGGTISDATGKVAADARVHVVPIDLLLRYRAPLEFGFVTLGIGPHLSVVHGSLSGPGMADRVTTDVIGGGSVAVGAQLNLGPGGLFLDLGYRLVTESEGLITGNAGGLTLLLGYRVTLW